MNEVKSPYMQQSPNRATHGRLIDADALEKELSKRWDISDDQDFCNKEVWDALRNAPTVQADRPHGEWIGLDECSVCGKQAIYFIDGVVCGIECLPNFCPNCGARMYEDGDDTTGESL